MTGEVLKTAVFAIAVLTSASGLPKKLILEEYEDSLEDVNYPDTTANVLKNLISETTINSIKTEVQDKNETDYVEFPFENVQQNYSLVPVYVPNVPIQNGYQPVPVPLPPALDHDQRHIVFPSDNNTNQSSMAKVPVPLPIETVPFVEKNNSIEFPSPIIKQHSSKFPDCQKNHCYMKCCPMGEMYSYEFFGCVPAPEEYRDWKPKVMTPDGKEIISDKMLIPIIHKLECDSYGPEDHGRLLDTGLYYIPSKREMIDMESYCIDLVHAPRK